MRNSKGNSSVWKNPCGSKTPALVAAMSAWIILFAALAAKADLYWSPFVNTYHSVRKLARTSPTTGAGAVCVDPYCQDDLWFAGENRKEEKPYDLYFSHLFFTKVNNLMIPLSFGGADLGASTYLQHAGKTIYFMGDSWGAPSSTYCSKTTTSQSKYCDDAILLSSDTNPSDGIDTQILMDTATRHFAPVIIPGVNKKGTTLLVPDYVNYYNVPCGVSSRILSTLKYVSGLGWTVVTKDQIWLFYDVFNGQNNVSVLACSTDNGMSFSTCYGDAPEVFSDSRFVYVAPVYISNARWDDIEAHCVSNSTDSMCKLQDTLSDHGDTGDGFLLFAAQNGSYRKSPLYLGYIPASSNAKYFWTGSIWSTSESQAKKVIPGNSLNTYIGDQSVKIAEDANGEPYLILLYDRIGTNTIFLRISSLYTPDAWSSEIPTQNRGYGPFIIENTINGTGTTLKLYHLISGWDGTTRPEDPEGNRAPYGVYSTPLLDASGNYFTWADLIDALP